MQPDFDFQSTFVNLNETVLLQQEVLRSAAISLKVIRVGAREGKDF